MVAIMMLPVYLVQIALGRANGVVLAWMTLVTGYIWVSELAVRLQESRRSTTRPAGGENTG
jgi:hypothetical protein